MTDPNAETEYIIQTTFNFKTEYIELKELSVENYLKKCGEKFLINFDCPHDVHLYNQLNATIEKHQFEKIVKAFWQSGSFCIKLVATPQKSDSSIITPKVSTSYTFKIQLEKEIESRSFPILHYGT